MKLVVISLFAIVLFCSIYVQRIDATTTTTVAPVTSTTICSSTDYCALLLNRIVPVDSLVYSVVMDIKVNFYSLPKGNFYLSVSCWFFK